MKTIKEPALKKHIAKKGINISRKGKELFKQYDYYQVINGYKYLFIDSIENIDDIKNKIMNPSGAFCSFYSNFFSISRFSSPNDLYKKVCEKICEKYGIELGRNPTIANMEREIKNIEYVRHIFSPNCDYEDFVRMYLFEHEIRNALLKYVLFIEERIKKIFITTLNNLSVNSNCLADISNYNLSGKMKNTALKSLSKIIGMHSNRKSKPILHKMEQELIVPFWIIINEMTLKQTLITANSLIGDLSWRVFQSLTNELTNVTYDVFDRTKSRNQIKREKNSINQFRNILYHLADFRNHLAHNQPLYCYNIGNHFPREYIVPRLDKKSPTYQRNSAAGMSYLDQQRAENIAVLSAAASFFGSDTFNTRTSPSTPFDIDLSWIIYALNRIMKRINMKNRMKENLLAIYKKYNIILSFSSNDYYIDAVPMIVSFLSGGHVVGKKTCFNTNSINVVLKKTNKYLMSSEYSSFNRCNTYYDYTGIDINFLNNI